MRVKQILDSIERPRKNCQIWFHCRSRLCRRKIRTLRLRAKSPKTPRFERIRVRVVTSCIRPRCIPCCRRRRCRHWDGRHSGPRCRRVCRRQCRGKGRRCGRLCRLRCYRSSRHHWNRCCRYCRHLCQYIYRRITYRTTFVNLITFPNAYGDLFLRQFNSMTMDKLITKNQLMFDASTGLKSSEILRMMRMLNRDDSPDAHKIMESAGKLESALEEAIRQIVTKQVGQCQGKLK